MSFKDSSRTPPRREATSRRSVATYLLILPLSHKSAAQVLNQMSAQISQLQAELAASKSRDRSLASSVPPLDAESPDTPSPSELSEEVLAELGRARRRVGQAAEKAAFPVAGSMPGEHLLATRIVTATV